MERQQKGLWLRAILFPGEDGKRIAEKLRVLGSTNIEVLDHRKFKSTTRILSQINSKDKLSAIAQLMGVN